MSILSILIWLPIVGGMLVLATGKQNGAYAARTIAISVASASMALCVPLIIGFDTQYGGMQFVEHVLWIDAFSIHYSLGVDGIAMPLVVLSTFTTLIIILASVRSIQTHIKQYLAAFLFIQGFMVGVFSAQDAILFYIFWEALLIPMFICIGVWGSQNRSYAAIKFFLYTFLGSVLLLAGFIYLYVKTGSFVISDYYPLPLSMTEQTLLFFGFLAAFAVKVPMWPVHTWLPDAHTEAPAGGSIMLAALMLKMGVYGFLRFTLPITPDASATLAWFIIALSLIAIVYISFVAIVQQDLKRLIAYSSIAHMGFATLGCFMIYIIFANTQNIDVVVMSLQGAMIVLIAHGFSSGALFLSVGMLYDRMHTREINQFGGIAHSMPVFAAFFMLFSMGNVALPGTANFVGEFLVIVSSFQANFWIAFLAATTLVLGAAYTLWMYKRVFYGKIKNEAISQLHDVTQLERFTLLLFALPIIVFGIYPMPLIDIFNATLTQLLEYGLNSKL